MSRDDPTHRRRYDATARRARGEQDRARTRATVLSAAHELFVSHGYAGTSMAAIARTSGVSVQTIYLAVGGKAEVLRAVSARAVLDRDDGTDAVAELPWVARLAEELDPHAQLQILVTELVALTQRAAPLWRVMAQAALEDEDIAADLREHEAGRLRDQRALVGMLRGLHVPLDRATDIVHGLLRPDLWQVFVVERGWSRVEVEALAVDLLSHLLLGAGSDVER